MNKRNLIKDFTQHIKTICSLLQVPVLEMQNDSKKKRSVVYLVTIQNFSVRFIAYALYTKEEFPDNKDAMAEGYTLVNAEEHFVEHNELWVGDIKKVFTDYTVTLESKYGPLVWCGTPYRSNLEDFYVDMKQPLMATEYYTKTLDSIGVPKPIITESITTDEQARLISRDLQMIAPSSNLVSFNE